MFDVLFATILLAAPPIKVLIIDTGLSSNNKQILRYVSNYDNATMDHGPAVAGLVLSDETNDWVCNRVKVDVCNYHPDSNNTMEKYYSCLMWAINNNYDYVNLSLEGDNYSDQEEILLEKITHKSVVIVAAGNHSKEISKVYPAAYLYKGWGNYKVITNSPNPSSNYGKGTINLSSDNVKVFTMSNSFVKMSGTSMSAARYTHRLLKDKCNETLGK